MSTNISTLKFKVLGFGAAAVIGATMMLGMANSATAASTLGAFACSEAAPTVDNGFCWNALASETDSSGDFRANAGFVSRFVNGIDGGPGGSDGDWGDLNFLTDGLLKSQFAYQEAFGAQDPGNIETVLEGSDWFGTDMTQVSDMNISGDSWEESIDGNVVYIHTGGFSMAFLYDDIPSDDFFIEFVGKGLSNVRILTTTVSAVPIPAALPLFGAALIGMAFLARRRKNK
jgi:hypothetical protein